jgi:hypothetical protein
VASGSNRDGKARAASEPHRGGDISHAVTPGDERREPVDRCVPHPAVLIVGRVPGAHELALERLFELPQGDGVQLGVGGDAAHGVSIPSAGARTPPSGCHATCDRWRRRSVVSVLLGIGEREGQQPLGEPFLIGEVGLLDASAMPARGSPPRISSQISPWQPQKAEWGRHEPLNPPFRAPRRPEDWAFPIANCSTINIRLPEPCWLGGSARKRSRILRRPVRPPRPWPPTPANTGPQLCGSAFVGFSCALTAANANPSRRTTSTAIPMPMS